MKQPDHPLVECGRDRISEDNQQRRVARRNDLHRFLAASSQEWISAGATSVLEMRRAIDYGPSLGNAFPSGDMRHRLGRMSMSPVGYCRTTFPTFKRSSS